VPSEVRWRLHLASPPEAVWELLATDEGRARFWAESAVERDGAIEFEFVNDMQWRGAVLARERPGLFGVEYFGGSRATFELAPDGAGGTDLTLHEAGVRDDWAAENRAGWVSVLLALKGACDFGVDLRNHDAARTWSQGYCDN
jgi:uncharacterized protein YndB with AHSA1/START domain